MNERPPRPTQPGPACAIALMIAILAWLPVASAAEPTPLVVLDPGHGGSNKGAFGAAIGRHEKHLTLVVARAVAERLRGARVLLTRYRDRYVSLRDRTLRANLAGADLFVSIHFNACESHSQRGFETYVLSHEASDREAARLASRENERLAAAQQPQDPVAAIISDLRQRALHGQSVQLAIAIQAALSEQRPGVRNRGVRQAPFDVLMGLRMPGVLVELGFLDHARESLELAQPAVLQRLASGIARGIHDYLGIKSGSRSPAAD